MDPKGEKAIEATFGKLIKKGFDVNIPIETNTESFPPIYWAATRGRLDLVKLFEKNNANINPIMYIQKDEQKWPLMFRLCADSATDNRSKIIDYLLTKKIDLTTVYNGYNIITYIACAGDNERKLPNLIKILKHFSTNKEYKGKISHLFFDNKQDECSLLATILTHNRNSTSYKNKALSAVFEWMLDNKDDIGFKYLGGDAILELKKLQDKKIDELLSKAKEAGILPIIFTKDFPLAIHQPMLKDTTLLGDTKEISVIKPPVNKDFIVIGNIKNSVYGLQQISFYNKSDLTIRKGSTYVFDKEKNRLLNIFEDYTPNGNLTVSWSKIERDCETRKCFSDNKIFLSNILSDCQESSLNKLYDIVKKLTPEHPLEYFDLNNQALHVQALARGKIVHLKVILEAANQLPLNSDKIIPELIIMLNHEYLIKEYINKNKACIDTKFELGNGAKETLLHMAVRYEKKDMIKVILSRFPNLTIKNSDNKTANELAQKLGLKEIEKLIKQHEIKHGSKQEEKKSSYEMKQDNDIEFSIKEEKPKTSKLEKNKKMEEIFNYFQDERIFEKEDLYEYCLKQGVKIEDYKKFVSEKNSLTLPEKSVEKNHSWVINDLMYSSDNKEVLFDEATNVYFAFDKKLLIQEEFLNAFNKGVAPKSKGCDGIKFIYLDGNLSLIEIKTVGKELSGYRYYTKNGYKNHGGDVLYVFNGYGTKETVKTKVIEGKIHYETVPSIFAKVVEDNQSNEIVTQEIVMANNHSDDEELNVIGDIN